MPAGGRNRLCSVSKKRENVAVLEPHREESNLSVGGIEPRLPHLVDRLPSGLDAILRQHRFKKGDTPRWNSMSPRRASVEQGGATPKSLTESAEGHDSFRASVSMTDTAMVAETGFEPVTFWV